MRSKSKSEGMSLVNFFTIAEAALIFGVRKKQIYDWIQAGRLRVFHLGRGEHAARIRRQDLDKLIKALRNGDLEIPKNSGHWMNPLPLQIEKLKIPQRPPHEPQTPTHPDLLSLAFFGCAND